MAPTLLLYDDDCNFCVWVIALIVRRDRARALRALPIQSATGDELLDGLDEAERLASWHAITPDGSRHAGGDAFPVVFGAVPSLAPLAALARATPPRVRRLGYDVVARNRVRLSRLVPAAAKRRARRDVQALERV